MTPKPKERQIAIDYCKKMLEQINNDTLDDYNSGKITKEQMKDIFSAQERARKDAKDAYYKTTEGKKKEK